MTQERWTKQDVTPGEDPREIDRERTSAEAVAEELAGQQGIVRPEAAADELPTSSSVAPGRDLSDLEDAPEVTRLRDEA